MSTAAARATSRLWQPPRLADRQAQPQLAPVARALERLARRALANVSGAISACDSASHGDAQPTGYRPGADPDRAWRLACDERDTLCVVDRTSERTMLGWLVGGTTARTLTSIEHSIVAECLRRLFVGDDGSGALREEPNERPTLHAVQCALDLHGRDGQAATVRLFAEDHGLEATPMAVRQPDLREVGLHVRASLPTVGVHLAEVRCWREGALVTMQRPQSEVAITLALGPKRVAVAQLGCVRGYRAARIIMVGVGRR